MLISPQTCPSAFEIDATFEHSFLVCILAEVKGRARQIPPHLADVDEVIETLLDNVVTTLDVFPVKEFDPPFADKACAEMWIDLARMCISLDAVIHLARFFERVQSEFDGKAETKKIWLTEKFIGPFITDLYNVICTSRVPAASFSAIFRFALEQYVCFVLPKGHPAFNIEVLVQALSYSGDLANFKTKYALRCSPFTFSSC